MKKFAVTAFLTLFPLAVQAADIKGMWLTDEGKAHVNVEPCGANVCGKIVWLKQPNDPTSGKPQMDVLNEDTSLRTRPVVGIKIFEMTGDAAGGFKGKVYNPEDGKTYSGEVSLKGDKLVVKGCGLGGLVCEDETWTKMN